MLGSGKAIGDKPVSRQMVYHIYTLLKGELAKKLQGILVGMYSCRKFAVQRIVSVKRGVFAASVWVGHGNGWGNLVMFEHYLNKSRKYQKKVKLRSGEGVGRFG